MNKIDWRLVLLKVFDRNSSVVFQFSCAPSMAKDTSPSDASAETARPDVVTKYRTAADLTNSVLQSVIESCVPGADIASLCKLGDALIEEKVEKLYTKREKGEKVGETDIVVDKEELPLWLVLPLFDFLDT